MFSLPIRTKKTSCPPSISLIYTAANPSIVTTYTPNLPLILSYQFLFPIFNIELFG